MQHLFGSPTYEGVQANALTALGAGIVYELALNIEAITKGLAER